MPQPASGKPSLIDTVPASGGPANEADTSIRMLDALESSARPAPGTAARRGFGWMLTTLLLVVACGASWFWWAQRTRADDTAERTAQASAPNPASAASAVTEPPTVATIVATPEAAALPASSSASMASGALAAASQPAKVDSTGSAATHHADAAPEKTKAKAAPSKRDTRVAAESKGERKPAAQVAKATGRSPSTAPSNDPDVALLSAMLATMSRDARGASDGTPSPQAQLTIAQLVQRCELRGVKDAIETFECKRRICDGYWGKADACPMSLSPKKN